MEPKLDSIPIDPELWEAALYDLWLVRKCQTCMHRGWPVEVDTDPCKGCFPSLTNWEWRQLQNRG